MKQPEKIKNDKEVEKKTENDQVTETGENLDELSQEADKIRTKKPGSQSNSSKQSNNGRGGGK